MLTIQKTNIRLTRGDTAYITIQLFNDKAQPYTIEEGDVVRCQIRTKPNTGKLITSGQIIYGETGVVWHLKPEDTAGLQVTTYYWDGQLERANGDIFTFVPCSEFAIMKEVTYDE